MFEYFQIDVFSCNVATKTFCKQKLFAFHSLECDEQNVYKLFTKLMIHSFFNMTGYKCVSLWLTCYYCATNFIWCCYHYFKTN
jgi:hypothetical protein